MKIQIRQTNNNNNNNTFLFTQLNRKDPSYIRQAVQKLDCLDQAVAVVEDPLPHLDQVGAVAEELHGCKSCDKDPAALVNALEVCCLHLFYTIPTWLSVDPCFHFSGGKFCC
jgi:hypothetical protein